MASWQAEHPDHPVPCCTLDLSDQCGEVWDALAAWLTSEGRPASELMMSGAGLLVSVRSGRGVLHVLAPLNPAVAVIPVCKRK